MHYKVLTLSNVWRTCNKIRAAIFRVGINLWDYCLPFDPKRNCLISESNFISIFAGQLKNVIGLSDEEINELADYFRVHDGRIFYAQMCEVIHNSVPDLSTNENLVTGLEWEDPLHTNRLSCTEERRLHLLITKIAAIVNLRRFVLRPYFQDYELVAKNAGTVTIAHFARILAYLRILVSSEDFNILVKKFIKDNYTVNYVGFLAAIDEIVKYFDKHGIADLGGDVLDLFTGRIIEAELPKLPRPEIGKVLLTSVFGGPNSFHPSITTRSADDSLPGVIKRIQRHVLENRIRVNEFFRDFDSSRCGKITQHQFHRGLEAMGVGSIQRLYLSLPEIQSLITFYKDPLDPDRVCWQTFENDIDQVFAVKCLEKYPMHRVDAPPENVTNLPRKGARCWQAVNTPTRDLCEEAVRKIKSKVECRRFTLSAMFADFDRNKTGHVSRNQLRRCLVIYNIFLSEEELYALEQRFNDDMGFNYLWFLKEIGNIQKPLYENFVKTTKCICAPKPRKPAKKQEKDIVAILAKIKGKVVRERIRVIEFLKDHDKHNEMVISRPDFIRALNLNRFDLSEHEIDTLIDVFASPMRREYVDYRRFADTVEEAFTQKDLERAPLLVPLQHLPTKDCDLNFLNFEQRRLVSMAMQKLSKINVNELNLIEIFQDHDKNRCGTINFHQLLQALSLRGLNNQLSSNEFDALCKCFSFERGCRDEFDYRAFCNALNVVYCTRKYKPF